MQIPSIQNISAIAPAASASTPNAATPTSENGFSDVFAGMVKDANRDLLAADVALQDFASGKTDNLQSVVMTAVKADLSFRFVLEMRNRMTEAYQEVSRMQF